MHAALAPASWAVDRLGWPTLEGMLLSRHREIDRLLDAEIGSGRITQVVEIAAGMSPRGYRFTQRYGAKNLTYVEADLPGMSERKRNAFARLGLGRHEVVDVDALLHGGSGSLEELFEGLDPDQGVAVVTEGLVNYLTADQLTALWKRLAAGMSRFERGLYLSDVVLKGALPAPVELAAGGVLGALVRSGTYLHHGTEQAAEAALLGAGFTQAVLHRPELLAEQRLRRSARTVRVIAATTC